MSNVYPAHHHCVYNAHIIIYIVKDVKVDMDQIQELAKLASVKIA